MPDSNLQFPSSTHPTDPIHFHWQSLLERKTNPAIDAELVEVLQQCIAIPSLSGHEKPIVELLARRANEWGMQVDVFETDESRLMWHPVLAQRHLPLAGRPTAVILLKGDAPGPTLMFNAHSDVVSAGDESQWRHAPWSGVVDGGLIYGRGACDTKGPLVAALGAMLKIKHCAGNRFRGTVGLEIIPGEEDCVDLGTLTSVDRGYSADAAIILEPTEGLPRCASRSGLRFEITVSGRAVHGTVKWLGSDAIAGLRQVLAILEDLEREFSRCDRDDLYADYPVLRPITVDHVVGGQWQGMVCDRAKCSGYFELCPGDDMEQWGNRLASELKSRFVLPQDIKPELEIKWVERYQGFSTPVGSTLCQAAEMVIKYASAAGRWEKWRGFNSGCEGGLRFGLHRTETLVWGPGSLAQAHRVDEYASIREVLECSNLMAAGVVAYLNGEREV